MPGMLPVLNVEAVRQAVLFGLAVDAEGNGAYGDISAVPHVTTAQWQSCIRGLVAPLLTDFGLPTLDGSDPACAWGSDEDAPVEGVFGYAALPKLVTRDYAGNSNDSYWLSNPDQLLEGYSPIIGRERSERSLRTRLGFVMARERIRRVFVFDGHNVVGVISASDIFDTL
jgi:acyl-homoserine-lactone acylase